MTYVLIHHYRIRMHLHPYALTFVCTNGFYVVNSLNRSEWRGAGEQEGVSQCLVIPASVAHFPVATFKVVVAWLNVYERDIRRNDR